MENVDYIDIKNDDILTKLHFRYLKGGKLNSEKERLFQFLLKENYGLITMERNTKDLVLSVNLR